MQFSLLLPLFFRKRKPRSNAKRKTMTAAMPPRSVARPPSHRDAGISEKEEAEGDNAGAYPVMAKRRNQPGKRNRDDDEEHCIRSDRQDHWIAEARRL